VDLVMPLRQESQRHRSFNQGMIRSTNNVWLHRFACALSVATLFLVALGGVVTTKGVGMAVPDWPTTYGENMFLFPPSKWIGGIFYEHSHRLVAAGVGMLTTILALWLWLKESRGWLRWLGTIAFFAVVFQGVLGGMRVVFDKYGLGTELGIFHATLAQLFFLLVCSIALFTSRWWSNACAPGLESATAPLVSRFFVATSFLILIQLVLGATMRHQHAGLAVPDFPLAYGKIWPSTDAASVELYNAHRLEAAGEAPITAPHIVVHMLHRFTAAAVLFAIIGCTIVTWRGTSRGSVLRKISAGWVAMVLVQAALGVLTILSQRKVDVTTAHVAIGALTFMIGWMLVLITSRSAVTSVTEQLRECADSVVPVPASRELTHA
jgi:cytochrome c oxidase assembly protein subunit 15